MPPRSLVSATFALAVLATPALGQFRPAPLRVDHPNLRAALHEVREAQEELKVAPDIWVAGHKERAMAALGDGIDSIRGILQVKEVNNFQGVDRTPEYYKRYSDHPRLRASLEDLRKARDELKTATTDFNGMKERAIDDIDVAVGEIVALLRATGKNPRRAR